MLSAVEIILRRISVRLRLIVAFTLILAGVTGIMGLYATNVMSEKILEAAHSKLNADLALGREFIDREYPGDWQIVNGKLFKGKILMEENYEAVDRIGELTGDTVTIFKNDTRVATNVKKDGERCINTQVSSTVAEAVLKKGEPYIGRADVVGTWNETAYEPIKDKDGAIVGIWYVGVPSTPYDNAVSDFRWAMVLYSMIGIFLGFAAAFLIAYTVYKPMERISTALEAMSKGDLTQKIPVKAQDEPGKLAIMVNSLVDSMADLIGKTKNLAVMVGESTGQVAGLTENSAALVDNMSNQAEDLKRNALQQAELTGTSRVTITEMTAAIQQVAENTQEVSTSAADASSQAQEGEQHVNRAVDQINVISSTVNSTASIVGELGRKSMEIGQIVDLITNIANQTNLLALNAAIEAARAGEQGKGFAVVAEEVRKLAEESGEAAHRIAELIKEIQGESGKAVHAMQEGTQEVAAGTEVIGKAGDAFKNILAAITVVNEQIQEMSAASEEMAASAETALQGIEQTAAGAENTAAAVEQINAMATEQMESIRQVNTSVVNLNQVVEELEQAVAFFKIQA